MKSGSLVRVFWAMSFVLPVAVSAAPGAASACGTAVYREIDSSAQLVAQAAQQIVSELRHQYFIAFEPDGRPGWHPIEVKTKKQNLIVRARSGYEARLRSDLFER